MSKDKAEKFKEIAMPVIKYLRENFHPHVTVVITPTTAEISEGICAFEIERLKSRKEGPRTEGPWPKS